MDKVILLENLRDFTQNAVSELLMPVRPQEEDEAWDMQTERPADVYLMRLPDSTGAGGRAPYIIHQVLTGKDQQKPGEQLGCYTKVRTIFCVYCADEQDGALMLLNLMERLRIELLKRPVIGSKYLLDLTEGLETLIYPDDTAPFYLGEMISQWWLPPVLCCKKVRDKRAEV